MFNQNKIGICTEHYRTLTEIDGDPINHNQK